MANLTRVPRGFRVSFDFLELWIPLQLIERTRAAAFLKANEKN